ncbi:YxeA family protein [Enterococcus asini]|uniref:YxeA family protein n=1 Tax=Enterococcus asini TaxID=57732 RepID=UPI00288C87CE|nr:YxeA family protein [Enterococcus asini]MDT2756655.1 YxeA family protein [Enterococcus asini]
MKKFILTILGIAVVLVGGLWVAQEWIMGGHQYYVQITTEGQRQDEKDDVGNAVITYHYELPGYDEDGKSKTMDFNSFEARPLKEQAYLKVTWNKNKGVTSWEEVTKNEVPKKAMSKLNQEG